MPQKQQLKNIVSKLRQHVQANTLDVNAVQSATDDLAKLGYCYDAQLFPPLPTQNWAAPSHTTPQSLAEALLWKMGKWKIYKSFAEHYEDTSSKPKNDVVFYAFAKHLQDPKKPIYDQHSLRAILAVDTNLASRERALCRSLLFKKDGNWKPIISGSKSFDGYTIYVQRVKELEKGGASLDALDKLLMPLGQALKDSVKNSDEFHQLAGCVE